VEVEQVLRPKPKSNEVLIRVRASTVASGDVRARSLRVPRGFGVFARPIFGFFGPRQRVLGTELSGTVDAVGSAVTKFKIGDRVFAFPGFSMGCHAEYRTMPEDGRIRHIPTGFTFEEAAALSFGGITALAYLQSGNLSRGEKLLVVGASGTVGSAAVQIAKRFEAEVTGVTSSPNVELVRTLGADYVIDYTRGDYLASGDTYDVVFDTVGAGDFAKYERALGKQGRLLLGSGSVPELMTGAWASMAGKHKVVVGPGKERPENMDLLKSMADEGSYKPLIDRSFPLERIAEAHAYVDTGRKRGSVVIAIGQS
jgi:NADPH:quinone reductase-like Zn-dependent oxidoreductase